MHRWADLFEECEAADRQDNAWTPEQDRAWSDEGLATAIEMKRELPGWTVVYHDGWRMAAADGVEVEDPAAFFEYEVTDVVEEAGGGPSQEAQACCARRSSDGVPELTTRSWTCAGRGWRPRRRFDGLVRSHAAPGRR